MTEKPDNRTAWNAVSAAYQERVKLPVDRLVYGVWCPDERGLQLLGDLRGKRALVLGCGGGQDCIALARMGAAEVTGIDLSDEQIRYGRELAAREGVSVRLLQGNVEDLSPIASESQDVIVSAHALNYVERVDRSIAETLRVLKPGGLFVLSVHHPFDACTEDDPPYSLAKGYWDVQRDWEWEYPEADVQARFRSWYRPMSEWFHLLLDAGFLVERILEPPPPEDVVKTGWEEQYPIDKARLIPLTLIFKARKPRY